MTKLNPCAEKLLKDGMSKLELCTLSEIYTGPPIEISFNNSYTLEQYREISSKIREHINELDEFKIKDDDISDLPKLSDDLPDLIPRE